MKKLLMPLALVALLGGNAAAQDVRGVTDSEITLGSHTDLSGPLALWGVPGSKGMNMRFDEANAAGGVHGRKINLIIEDSQYQVPRAIQAANKLLRRDNIFAMVGALGTPHNLAVERQQLEANVPNMFPMSASRVMASPPHPMKYSFYRSYYDQMRAAAAYFHDNGGFSTPCVAMVANEVGEEMTQGVTDQLAIYDQKPVAKTEHAITETDFISSVTTLKNANCDIVFLNTGVRDTILIVATSRKLGFNPIFVTGLVPYMDAVASAADGAINGLYLVSPVVYATAENAEGESKRILDDYAAKHGEAMDLQAQMGYIFADLTVKALEDAGSELTVEKFIAATEAIKNYIDPIGGQSVTFNPEKHEGVDTLILAKVEGGKWAVVARGLEY